MEPLDLALGLRMVGLTVLDGDPEGGELGLEPAAAVAELGGEDAAVIRQHRGRQPKPARTLVERGHHVGRGGHRQHHGDRHHPRVVVDEIENLHPGAVSQGPVGHVRLPGLVGQVRLEPLPGLPGPLLGLGDHEPPPGQGPVDGRSTRSGPVALAQVVLDREGPGVEAVLGQLLADHHDLVLERCVELGRTPVGCCRRRDQRLVAAGPEASHLFGHPGLRHVERRGHRPEGPPLDHHSVNGVAGTIHGHHLNRCPRCPGTWCPLSHGTGHCRGHRFLMSRGTREEAGTAGQNRHTDRAGRPGRACRHERGAGQPAAEPDATPRRRARGGTRSGEGLGGCTRTGVPSTGHCNTHLIGEQ